MMQNGELEKPINIFYCMSKPQKTILVIEDDLAYQKILLRKLSMEGFTVLTAGEGEQGLTLALDTHPDLILLDLFMPGEGGTAVLEKLRQDEWGKSAKVAVLSNFAGDGPVSQVLEHGVAFYFVKSDTSLEELVEKITDLLE